MRQARKEVGADLSKLVLQGALSEWENKPLTASRKIYTFGKCA
jgi:hypothetical protein